ncbi:hypothetical protein [Mycolicibacterium komossense]|uniref:hypothetical protein n=1 Tax=Mycolicibacterium komossense TaxID=1779 RepID=UPI0021F2A909|nr:hypothetical protein [Mycolicibacterium komossense]
MLRVPQASWFYDAARRWALGATAVAAVIASLALAPSASADGADAVIADLEAKGYLVQINWLNGFDAAPLSRCTVVQVHNPNTPSDAAGGTVYVDVHCPNHQDD